MIPLPVSALGSVLTSGATPAARCAPRSAGTESLSSGFRQAAGRSIGHAEWGGHRSWRAVAERALVLRRGLLVRFAGYSRQSYRSRDVS